jgi:hypothetical protein
MWLRNSWPSSSVPESVFSRVGRDSLPMLMLTMSAPNWQFATSSGNAIASIAAARSELIPAPASVSTFPTTSSAPGATPAYLPLSVSSGAPSPVPVAIPETCVPCP